MSDLSFIHLTDLHLVAPGQSLYGLDPAERLRAAIDSICRRHGPDGAAPAEFAVVTGDLAHLGEVAAYELLADIIKGLPFPCHLLLGNHDEREAFLSVFGGVPTTADGHVQQVLSTAAGLFVMLDTNEAGTHAGRLGEARLAWLKASLADTSDPVFLFLHHPPAASGIVGMDQIPLLDADALWQTLKPHRQRIRHIFHGHLHRPLAGSWHGIPFSSLRGTNHQVTLDFAENTKVLGNHEPPAYAFVRISDEEVVVHTHDYLDAPEGFGM
ncbi:MAG: phosphodiesterase [Roseomonas sp.]|nr:phosphodiesterase [Roseomonas sp.]MCA3284858.1 phosphodiesterase [Roseomonas sp.]MCA3300519.1 phosphodiesterase [Roseomonas sp.]